MCWIPYEERLGYKQDFDVQYRFYSEAEGGRKTGAPHQGYRCDFLYDSENPLDGTYMIWPEFESEDGRVINSKNLSVPNTGTARMWIVDARMRARVHQTKIKLGTRGYFMEGGKRVAELVVVKIRDLHINPIED